MGTYTKYKLTSNYGDLDKHIENLSELSGYSTDVFYGCYEAKWYDHEVDMKKYSLDHKDVLFTLKGIQEGEEIPFIKYFKSGKMQLARVEYVVEPFNEDYLE